VIDAVQLNGGQGRSSARWHRSALKHLDELAAKRRFLILG
jgi:hypothetical protein